MALFKTKKSNSKEAKVRDSVLEFLPLKCVAEGQEYFVTSRDTILDIVQIRPRSLRGANDTEQEYVITMLTYFFRAFVQDFKIVSMVYPCITTNQQHYLGEKLSQTENAIHAHFLEQKIRELQVIEESVYDKEYYLFFYAKDAEEYANCLNVIDSQLAQVLPVNRLSVKKKTAILSKMFNQDSRILI